MSPLLNAGRVGAAPFDYDSLEEVLRQMADEKKSNPFRIINAGDGDTLEGIEQGARQSLDVVATILCLKREERSDGMAIARLPFLWAPPAGSKIRLTEPNRDAEVWEQVFAIEPGALISYVYIRDPAYHPQIH